MSKFGNVVSVPSIVIATKTPVSGEKPMSQNASPMKRISKPEDVPMGHHYAVIVYKTSSVYIPGNER